MKTIPALHPGRTTVKFALIAGAIGTLYALTYASPDLADGGGMIATAVAAQPPSSMPAIAGEADEPEDTSARDYCFGA